MRSPDPILVVHQKVDIDSARFPSTKTLTAQFVFYPLDPLPDLPDTQRVVDAHDGIEKVTLSAWSTDRRCLEDRAQFDSGVLECILDEPGSRPHRFECVSEVRT